jgi:hypothetical protein
LVKPDIQNDIYHLFAYGPRRNKYYCGMACIPNYKTSKFMNQLFRNIKENTKLDSLEESDNEEEFQDLNQDKYVDLDLEIPMQCTFHQKFKKWLPIQVVENNSNIVHVSRLFRGKII